MKKTCIRFLFVLIILSGLQLFLFPQEKIKIAVIPKGKEADVLEIDAFRCKFRSFHLKRC